MKYSLFLSLLIITCLGTLVHGHLDYYIAAVVEYAPYSDVEDTVAALVKKNAEEYANFIAEAKGYEADIIVFPEVGLVSYGKGTSYATRVPPPAKNVNPCIDNTYNVTDELAIISCAARQYQMHVVVNIPEIQMCNVDQWDDDCTRNGTFYYNCNVAFDRTGTIVARYRKTHLFYETGFTSPSSPDFSIFKTDFGVTFGMFICFDIIFREPSLKLVHEMNITDVIFSTAWFSELPFLTAVQEQSQWSYSADVNFLGSGYSKPSVGSTGSGIYAGRDGPVVTIMVDSDARELLVAKVPKKKADSSRIQITTSAASVSFGNILNNKISVGKTRQDSHKIYVTTEDLSIYETEPLAFQQRKQSKTVCYKKFCCDFQIEYDSSATSTFPYSDEVNVRADKYDYQYRLVAYQGQRKYGETVTGDIQTCAVISCRNSSLASCGASPDTIDSGNERNEIITVFSKIKISGTFRQSNGQLMPNTLLSNYAVLDPRNYEFEVKGHGESIVTTLSANNEIKDLLTFGIYGTMY